MGDVIRLADGGLMPVLEYVQRELTEVLTTKPTVVVLDLSAQVTVGATAMAALLWVKHVCSTRAIPVVLDSPSNAWIDVLRRADLLERASSEDTMGEAAFAVMWPPLARASQCGTR
ncbi:STAS domain-containing protein [Nocardioides islandensis]|uniref:STAS domain-containing protein n=1 Tax=Nocardioides islandensis TaxID=433663 RepID=A0A930VDD3_9ACTN|nr:STAS domain-containing protein [Nocardioides islandensis]MBF4764418.1 STAS domain-containing protein [Nocardioides islandensis]